jgi:very-short-patch-repair endonuclease
MKSIEKVIKHRTTKIESNNLKVVEYIYNGKNDRATCLCIKCGYKMEDKYINLSYKNYRCKYCILLDISEIIKNGDSVILNIDGGFVYLVCRNNHKYRQDRRNLLMGKKCNRCYLESKTYTLDEVCCEFNRVHGDYYSYNMEKYNSLHSKIEITCKKNHKFFQKVSNHMQGKGCPVCRESLGERTISKYLEDNNIEYGRQKKFSDCKYLSHLPFDFYLPDYNTLIEFDGVQHFKPIKQFGGEKEFEKVKIKDSIKNQYCLDRNINLIRISYQDSILEKLMCIKEHIIL